MGLGLESGLAFKDQAVWGLVWVILPVVEVLSILGVLWGMLACKIMAVKGF